MITREELVKLAREAAGGINRPVDECSDANRACPLAVTNPASYDPPEWVLEAMKRAYDAGAWAMRHVLDKGGSFTAAEVSKAYDEGRAAGQRGAAGLYPEGG